LRRTARRFPISLLEFGMRLAVGATFFRSGMNKPRTSTTPSCCSATSTSAAAAPEIAAYMGTTVELAAPVLLTLASSPVWAPRHCCS